MVLSGRVAQPGASLQSQSLWTEELLLTLFARSQVQAVILGRSVRSSTPRISSQWPLRSREGTETRLFYAAAFSPPLASLIARSRWLTVRAKPAGR